MLKKKKTDVIMFSSINFEYSNSEIIVSKNLQNYGNNYLWNSLLYYILLELTNNAQITINFFDKQMYDIFTYLISNNLIKCKNDDIRQIVINSCNKRIITELLRGYSFFDYSNILTIFIYEITGERRCCISPIGDNLGLKITHFNNFSFIETIIEGICNSYNINIERKNCDG